jgi:RNA polymerase sigma-70 factor (ECF subfamily)
LRTGWADLRSASEAALVIAAQARDERAFAELIRRRQGWLRALFVRLCGSAAEADDLAQDTFIRAWDKIGDLRQPLAFGGWLRRLAVMRLLQSRRRKSLDTRPADGNALPSNGPAPDSIASARLDLARALAVLSPAERLCIVLNLGEGMSHGEIEAATGLPLGTIKSHIARGQAKLRRASGDPDG